MNWQDKINKAKETGSFTYEDHIDAGHWETCAVGEIFKIDKTPAYIPMGTVAKRTQLTELGYEFERAVLEDKAEYAEVIYKQIKELKNEKAKQKEEEGKDSVR